MAFRLQSDEERNKYLRQLYGGNPPSMDYYRQLGAQKRSNEEAARAAREAQKRAEKEAEKRRKEAEKKREKAEQERAAMELIRELSQVNRTTPQTPSSSSSRSGQIGGGILDTLGGMVGSVGRMAKEGVGNLLHIVNPFDDVPISQAMRDVRERTQQSQRELEQTKGYRDARNLVHSAAQGATFGQLGNKNYTEDNVIGILGNLAGSVVPGAGIVRALQGTRAAARITPGMTTGQRAAQRAKEGATAGALYGVADAGITELTDPDRYTAGQHLRNIGLETAFGGILDPAIGRLIDAIPTRRVTRPEPPEPRLSESAREQIAPRRQQEILALPEPQQPTVDLASVRPELERNQRQLQELEQLLETRRQEFSAENELEITNLRQRQQELRQEYEQMRQAFVEKRRTPYVDENEVARAMTEWQNVKQMRQRYKELRNNIEKFRIPKEYAEEYRGLFPRSFIDQKSSLDVFKAAEAAGYEGNHQGAQQFGQEIRRLYEATKTKMKDLVPERPTDAQLRQVDEINAATFPETEEAQALERVINAYDEQIEKLRNMSFENTDEYQSTMRIAQVLRNEIERLQNEINRVQPQEPTRLVSDSVQVSRNPADGPDVAATTEPPATTNLDDAGFSYDRGDGGRTANSQTGVWARTISRITDDLDMIRRIENYAGEVENKMYKRARLVRGASGAAEVHINRTLTPAVTRLKQAGKLEEGNRYILDKHLLRVKELNPEYKLPGGRTEEQLRQVVQQFENDPDIQEYANAVREYQNSILDMLEEADILSKEAKEELKQLYPDYVPLFRSLAKKRKDGKIDLDDVFSGYEKISRGNVRKAIMELSEYGSENLTNRPIDNLVQYGINAHHAAFSNRAFRELHRLDGVEIDGKVIAERIHPKTEKKYPKENIVTFFENGSPVKYYVNDDLARAFTNLKGIAQFDEVANFFHAVAKLQRQSITANPIFTIKQLFRDVPQAWVVGDFSLIRDLIPAFLDTVSMIVRGKPINQELIDNFYRHGAGLSNLVSFDRSQFLALQKASKQLKQRGVVEVGKDNITHALRSAFDAVRRLNENLENMPKMAQFRATARRTGDLDEAAYQARDIMDFTRSGESIRNINRYAAFINATIQGRSKQLRALKERPLETGLKTAIVGAIPSIIAYQALHSYASETQRRIINESPEWQRQTYWLFPSPFDDETVWRIPKPYEVAVLSSTPIEYFLHQADKVGTDGRDALIEWFNQAIFVDPSLNPLTPIYEQITGVDTFTKQPIVPMAEQGLPASEQYDVRTNPLARGVSNLAGNLGLEVSPRRAEHLIEGYMPMASETFGDIVGAAAEKAGVVQNPTPAGTRRIPLIDDLRIKGDNYLANTLVGQAYDTQREVQSMRGQSMDSGRLFPYNNAYRALNQIVDRDREFAAKIRSIDNDPNLSAEEKARRRQQLLEERNTNVRRAQALGFFDTDTSNLARLEERWKDLGAENTRTEYERTIVAQLVQAGIPEVDANELMKRAKEADWDMVRLASEIRNLLQRRN